jgi:iron complex outermembrane recepter protein
MSENSSRPSASRLARNTLIAHSSPCQASRLTPLAAAVFAVVYPVAPALAQNPDIEEIIVTATKREMNMQDLGQSISTLSSETIARQAMQGMEDFVRALPSVSLSNSLPGRNSVTMRGVSTGLQEFYTDSQVAIYLDEQPVTTISQQPDLRMIDIARIESLPGPQGTLFGSSSQAGTLRVITNPPDPGGFSSQIDAGTWSTQGGDPSYDLSGWVNIPLVADKLAIRAVAFTSHEGGWIDNVLGTTLEGSEDNSALVEKNFNVYDNNGGRIAARWTMSDDWEMDLSYIAQNSSADGSWESDPALGDYEVARFFKEYRDDDWHQVSATVKGDLGFAELTVTASDFSRDVVYEWDNMVYEQYKDAYWGPYYALYNSDYTFGTIFNDQTITRSAYEARLTSQGDSRFNWMIGGYYEQLDIGWFYGAKNPDYVGTTSWYAAQAYAYYYNYLGYDVQYPLPETDIGYSQLYKNSVDQKAVFGEMSFDLTDRLTATLGARRFEFDRFTSDTTQFPQGLPPAGAYDTGGNYSSSGNDSSTVYKVGLTYDITDDIMVYGLFSQGFRLGGNNSARAASTGFVPLVYDPDTLDNYEIGLKSRLAGGRLVLNATVFWMVWDKIQINQDNVDNRWWLRGTINGGKAENKGVELSATWQATENLYLEASGFFGNPEFTERIVRFDDVVPAGAPMVWSPEKKFKLALEYTIPGVFGGDMWLRYDYSYEGEKWRDLNDIVANDPNGIAPAWDISNAHVGLEYDNGWTFQLHALNLWNEKAVDWLVNDTSAALFGDPRFDHERTYSKPRTVGLSVTKRFD